MKTARQRRIITGLDLVGWDAIAGAIDVSIRKAQDLAQRDKDPLPAKKFAGRIRASSDALREWAARQTEAV